MGFFTSLFGRSDDYQEEEYEAPGALPELYSGMTLEVETPEGAQVLTGRLSGYIPSEATLTLERLPGALSFGTREVGSSVVIKGISEAMTQFYLRGTIQESNRVVCRIKDVKVKNFPEQRHNFRLRINVPATLFAQGDEARKNPEPCTLVDISTGGACVESEVLRLKVELADYAPMEFLGEVIRVTEPRPGWFRYGFLFAQLKEAELTDLTRTLYNIQVGNRQIWVRGG